ncbi:MAG: AsmA family protein [Planctomycetota bacterium]|jgi:hypothetical protein
MPNNEQLGSRSNVTSASRPRRRRWLRVLVAALVILIAAVIAGNLVLVPRIARRRVIESFENRWAGPIEVGRVMVGRNGTLVAYDIVLKDDAGATWAECPKLAATFRAWPAWRPKVKSLELTCPHFHYHANHALPLATPSPGTNSALTGVEEVRFLRSEVSLSTGGQVVHRISDVPLDLRRLSSVGDPVGRWHVVTAAKDADKEVSVEGEISVTRLSSSHGRIKFDGQISAGQCVADLLVALTRSDKADDAFDLAASVTTNGASLKAAGELAATIHNVTTDRPTVTGDLTIRTDLISASARFAALIDETPGAVRRVLAGGSMKADGFGGGASGDFRAILAGRSSFIARGQLEAEGIDLKELASALGRDKPSRGQLANGRLDGSLTSLNWDGLRARGLVLLDDVPLRHVKVLRAISAAVTGPAESQTAVGSDAAAVFTVEGSTLSLRRGRLGDKAILIDAVPGGTVDLREGDIDTLVNVALVSDVRDVLRSLPFMRMMVGFGDALTRLHVSGAWQEPRTTPAPSVAPPELVDFFSAIAGTGGQFGPTIVKPMEDLYGQLPGGDKSVPDELFESLPALDPPAVSDPAQP